MRRPLSVNVACLIYTKVCFARAVACVSAAELLSNRVCTFVALHLPIGMSPGTVMPTTARDHPMNPSAKTASIPAAKMRHENQKVRNVGATMASKTSWRCAVEVEHVQSMTNAGRMHNTTVHSIYVTKDVAYGNFVQISRILTH